MTPAQALSAKLRARRRRLLTRKWASWHPCKDKPINLSGLSKAEQRAYCERIAADIAPQIIARMNRRTPLLDLVPMPRLAPAEGDASFVEAGESPNRPSVTITRLPYRIGDR